VRHAVAKNKRGGVSVNKVMRIPLGRKRVVCHAQKELPGGKPGVAREDAHCQKHERRVGAVFLLTKRGARGTSMGG